MDPHAQQMLVPAPAWSLGVGELGRIAILSAICFFAISALGSLFAFRSKAVERIGAWGFTAGCLGLITAFVSLGTLFLTHQFHFIYVFNHSDKGSPLAYQIAAIWSGQEGSFLLWATLSAAIGLVAIRTTGEYRRWFTVVYAAFLGGLAGILAYESPFRFELLDGKFAPPDGSGLNPTLMNPWVTIHPPVIFLGFGSLTILFAWAWAALLKGDHNNWAPMVRPWAIFTATLLGIGLCMGGFWAYETLGWGGFWAWDPVENQSFVSWVWVVALIHGLFMQVSRKKWVLANILLSGTSLLTFLYGTYLTRSGVLKDTSVHSFAEMNTTALRMLIAMFVVFTGGFAISFVRALWRHRGEPKHTIAPPDFWLNRERFYSLATWTLLGLGVAAGLGMSVPFFQFLRGEKPKIVEEHLYNQLSVFLFIPLMLGVAIAPLVTWRGMSLGKLFSRVAGILGASFLILTALIAYIKFGTANEFKQEPGAVIEGLLGLKLPLTGWILFLAWICIFAATSNLARLAEMARKTRSGLGGFVTHVGVVVTMLGLIVSRGLERKEELVVQAGNPGFAFGNLVRLLPTSGKNFFQRENTVDFELVTTDKTSTRVSPVLFYTLRPNNPEPAPTVRPAVVSHGLYDVYVAIYPMAFEAGNPVTLRPGESHKVDDLEVTYKAFKREGEAGMAGTKFSAELLATDESGSHTLSPAMKIGDSGPEFYPAETQDFTIAFQRMDAANKAVTLQFFYKSPLYPLDIYYKPLTILVWIGAGIMAIGGFWSALSRRSRQSPLSGEPKNASDVEHSDLIIDASLTAP
ncbi:MAG: cytochrome c biogenesis protein CcsA [Armatimonadetes bacterium]|nr:cytochrome c biogenesis protein CcsA [Armatimonadota bacterium]